MDYSLFMEKIGMCPEGVAVFNKLYTRCGNPTFCDAVKAAYQAFDEGDEAFQGFLQSFAEAQNVKVEEANLFLYIYMLDRTYQCYQSKGISDDVFFETLKTFAWACNQCYSKTGIYGINQVTYRAWYRRHLNSTIFRLGRLEFEIIGSLYDYNLDGHQIHKGDTCMYVHIPGGTPLDFEECEATYEIARDFFKKHFAFDPVIFYCGSWLLHPWLTEDLPATSRIVKFQQQFQLADIVQDEVVIRNWLFDHSDAPFDELPVKTSLHKAAVHRLKNGLPIGYARGYRY